MVRKRCFKGKVVFITGAAGGIGRALSRRFGRAGAVLVVTDLDPQGAEALARDLSVEGMRCLGMNLDVTDEEACSRAIAETVSRFGRLDVLVNNAGITHRSAFAGAGGRVYRRVMAVNYFGSLYCTQAALVHLVRSRGMIVVVSSIAGFAPLLGRTGYAASKHALHGLFGSLRTELVGTGVGITIVCPGFTDTNIERNALDADCRPTSHPRSQVGKVASPDGVADKIFKAAARNKRLLVLSTVGRLTRVMTFLCPSLYERIMAHTLKSELKR